MKKVLFATTALIATAGVASAEVALSGSAQIALIYQEAAANSGVNETVTQHEVDLKASMSTVTDDGLTFAAGFTIEGDEGTNDGSTVSVTGAFGTITVGDGVAEAGQVAGISDIGIDGSGVDDVVADLAEQHTASVAYTTTMGAVAVAISADMGDGGTNNGQTTTNTNNAYGIGLSYSANDVTLRFGYGDTDDSTDTSSVFLGLTYAGNGYTVSLASVEESVGATDTRGTGATLTYELDATNDLVVSYADRDTALWDASYGVMLKSDLGGGATFNVGVASVYNSTANENRNNAQVGVALSF